MLKAVKIKLYPNKIQQVYISKLLGCYRLVYNKCLDKKKTAYAENKQNLGLNELGNYFHQDLTKSEEFKFLTEHNTKVLKQSILNMLDSYKRFFINGSRFPKFKSKHDNKQSCRFPIDAISTINNYQLNKLTLTSQLKSLKFRCSDKDKNYLNKYKSGIKSATLTRTKSGNYFLSILVEGNVEKQLPKALKDIVGIDLGIKDFIITSNNQHFDNIKIKRDNEKKLIKLNRQLSRKNNGSKNKNKARIKLAKFHEKLNNQKENYLHQVTNQLLNENQIVAIEDLNVSGMMSNHKLAKSIQELSLTRFKNMLIYKANWYDRHIVEIDRWFPSSKLCNVCGYKNNNLTLKDRSWKCPECRTIHDRDYNAAINIEKEGLRILIGDNKGDNQKIKIGCRTSEYTLVDYPTKENRKILMDDKAVMPLKSSDRLKQEILNV
jgi:putative transposase